MSEAREWNTVAEAAVLTGRHKSRIYAWIDQDRVATRTNVALRTSGGGHGVSPPAARSMRSR
ncbi:hypothetical protein AVP41_01492 [Microbacterium sp. TNHR37B]|nr:hypothetical protein AVP41_01492 [Microbacterium sp. TNHR37B]